MFELLIILIPLSILVFAIIGFVASVMFIFKNPSEKSSEQTGKRNLQRDAIAASHLINLFRRKNEIDQEQFVKLRNLIEQRVSAVKLPPAVEVEAVVRPQSVTNSEEVVEVLPSSPTEDDHSTSQEVAPVESDNIPVVPVAPDEPVVADAIEPVKAPSTPAPWDVPDTPTAPRRTFTDVLANFMQDKNIRWGELASGILIIGSAIGLVVSLRAQLTETIPYFPALLFLLITAAIHAAGSYTLRKWKLRDTSRGVLVIGLFMVPLNFLSACLLSEQRPLTDPVYWTAMLLGFTAFAGMTWWSSKLLFRKGYLAFVTSILGLSFMILVVNRLVPVDSSGWLMALTLPIGLLFLLGTGLTQSGLRAHRHWTDRSLNRMYLYSGISGFAMAAAVSMVVIRSGERSLVLFDLSPLFLLASMTVSGLGLLVGQYRNREASLNQDATIEIQNRQIISHSLIILGLVLAGIAWLAGALLPIVFLVSSLLLALLGWLLAWEYRVSWLRPIAGFGLATGVLVVVNVLLGPWDWSGWQSMDSLGAALFSSQSGLALMGLGGVLAACISLPVQARSNVSPAVWRMNLISAGGIAVVGCGLALVAGFVHRDSVFDTMTASGLLLLTAVVTLIIAAMQSRQLWWVHVAAGVLFAGLSFSTLWNPTIAQWLYSFGYGYTLNWMVVVSFFSLLFAAALLVASLRSETEKVLGELALYAGAMASVTSLAGFHMAFYYPGLGTSLAVSGALAWLAIAGSLRDGRSQISEPLFVVSTALLISTILVSFSSSWGLPSWTTPAHWLIQCSVLAVWALGWMVAAWLVNRHENRFGWLLGQHLWRGEQVVLALTVIGYSLLLIVPLVELTSRQIASQWQFNFYDGSGDVGFLVMAYVAVFATVLISFLIQPFRWTGDYLVVGWIFGWSLFAFGFVETVSVASALRWLLACSGLVSAAGVVCLARATGGFADSSWFSRVLSIASGAVHGGSAISGDAANGRVYINRLLNQFLALAGGGVLLISSITVATVMLQGAGSLGGPQAGSWFASLPLEVSYGVPAVLLTTSLLMLSITMGRTELAVLGSAVYQYVVLFMLVLLVLSPHPKLATSWFVNILQATSIGMSLYGFIWFVFRKRISGEVAAVTIWKRLQSLEVHTAINLLLVTSLAGLIAGQIGGWPDQTGGWINTAGSPFGLSALLLVVVLGALVIGALSAIRQKQRLWNALIVWTGMSASAMLAALLDMHTSSAFIGIRTIVIGGVLTSVVLAGKMTLDYCRRVSTSWSVWPLASVASFVAFFAFRASQYDSTYVWGYVAVVGLVIALVTALGILIQRVSMQYLAAAMGIAATIMVADEVSALAVINVGMILMLLISGAWSIAYALKSEQRQRPHVEGLLINVMLVLSPIWMVLVAFLELFILGGSRVESGLFSVTGIGFVSVSFAFLVLTIWARAGRLFLAPRYAWLLGTVIAVTSYVLKQAGVTDEFGLLWVSFAVAVLVLAWGWVWASRKGWLAAAKRWHVPRLEAVEGELRYQLPVYVLLTGSLIFWVSSMAISYEASRPFRYLAAMTPFLVAIAVGCLSNSLKRRGLQLTSLVMVTACLVLLALADLPVTATFSQWLVRLMLVLAGTMFVYGGLVSRWTRSSDSWLRSLREMASVTCAAALPCLLLLVCREFADFDKTQGCGVSVVDAVGVAVAVLGMVVGLITIAIRPQFDPFAMSVQGRTIYVYVAQAVVVLLSFHLYFTMPWLFQYGLAQYWPYLMIGLAFGGVGVAHLLQQRQLLVLAQPLFNTAIVLPILVSIGVFAAGETKADSSLVLLGAGSIYLMLSYTQKSFLSGGMAIVLGNLALWVFYDKFPSFSFVEHPQLWLIPPAVSVLVAGQLFRHQIASSQLALLRYVCLATIYISSTSDIFIAGVGEQLWPPIILALLAVAGILCGIGFRIRAFLYLGTLFLLLSMVAMVYHAQQALHHTWPWWVFGICMGTAILFMFGMFEKRRNKMKQIAEQLQQWDL